MNLSEQQEAIVRTAANKVVVIASAASGKTAVLTERVIRKLKNGISIKNLLILTFTNNAANMGGAIFSYKSNTTTNISNCIFNKNTADNGGSISANKTLNIYNSTFTNSKHRQNCREMCKMTFSLSRRCKLTKDRYNKS